MNTQNVTNSKPRVGGAIFTAPLGTKLPTDALSDLSSSYESLGYISEDGVTNSNSPSSETIKAWGGATVLVIQSEKPDEFTYKLIEATNINVLKEVYGKQNVQGTLETGISIVANDDEYEPHVIVIDMVLKGALKRIVMPNAVIKEVGEIAYGDADAVGYETTIECLPDEKGNKHYEYIQKPKQQTERTTSVGGSK